MVFAQVMFNEENGLFYCFDILGSLQAGFNNLFLPKLNVRGINKQLLQSLN